MGERVTDKTHRLAAVITILSCRKRGARACCDADTFGEPEHGGPVAALAVRMLTAWAYALRGLGATVLPGRDARRYWMHARYSLFPASGEGLREAAAELGSGS